MMDAGQRKTSITFERKAVVQDGVGEEIETWGPLGARLARVYWGKGEERRQAAAEQGSQTASFVVLADSLTRTITVVDRIALDGSTWDITAITPIDSNGLVAAGEIEFVASRSV